MTKPPVVDFFSAEASKMYDERNRQLSPISDCLHFLIRLMVRQQPINARVLCVGVGTGAEILSLAKAFPQWTFVGVDPSLPMLEVCRQRLQAAGVWDRCELVHGYVDDVERGENFDLALSILVGHFVARAERRGFFQAMSCRLRKNGYLVNTEISFDLNSPEFASMLKNWEGVQMMMGATPESLTNLPLQLREMLTILSPNETEDLIRQSGIAMPIRFFQAFMICGWYGIKTE
ncbi:MAG: class I SAM-dependent methyltransferase [Bdellovibrionaceae bacterium]|nr:class I SAM-dependent methyltransferase [Pseudobdellovibrionaceae bacterium]